MSSLRLFFWVEVTKIFWQRNSSINEAEKTILFIRILPPFYRRVSSDLDWGEVPLDLMNWSFL